ncbi:elongation factor EF-G [Patellaria atrata CBS 101060]|uniref:Ribosome-releasing factor 2, mitochondrial n=1 Tax=Patellaria atrata CBS 101060 TaxID=1346257 RepID=A0A9P4S0Y6_9PEZI|nr:elongation factor EF-G [Patellaria atrata CBS 101060]
MDIIRRSSATATFRSLRQKDWEKISFLNSSNATRNIGIIAHIDAGKTTTTERMLYYSGYTRRIGDVDDGSTVTDFLPAERARGITIQSAAITFNWPPVQGEKGSKDIPSSSRAPGTPRSQTPHLVNLIDTPGHADFTFEVLRSLRILDGAVCILDGVAGVEAQTEKVWTQANNYRIPKIIYVNKLDRDGAAFGRTVKEVGVRLHGWPALCQIPWWKDGKGKLIGVGDVVNLRALSWEEGGDGKVIKSLNLTDVDDAFAKEIKKARVALIEILSEHDDEMVEKFLEYDEDHLAIPGNDLTESLRRCVLQNPQRIIPVFTGASFRNLGVQPLLDAVLDLLPSPEERPDPEISMGVTHSRLNELLAGRLALTSSPQSSKSGKQKTSPTKTQKTLPVVSNLQACALAFKVVNDPRRGVLVYVRVYSGSIDRNAALYNTNLSITERAPKLLRMYASDAVEVDSIAAGHIGVIVGLKYARTGDTLIVYSGANPKSGPPAPLNTLQLRPISVPPPVFFTSVEPNSLSEEKLVSDTLGLLLREDPSLNVSIDSESGQTHLAGMGELHLEIARDRLINDFKARATTGKIEIGYREAILSSSPQITEDVNREVAGKHSRASCTVSVSPLDGTEPRVIEEDDDSTHTSLQVESNDLIIHHPTYTRSGLKLSPDSANLPEHLPLPSIVTALRTGISAALSRGPTHGFSMHSTLVEVHLDPAQIHADSTPAAISTAVRLATQKAVKSAAAERGTVLMEPVMLVAISVNEADIGGVAHDISAARGGQVLSLDGEISSPVSPSATLTTSTSTFPTLHTVKEDFPPIDPRKIYTPPDPFASTDGGEDDDLIGTGSAQRRIVARVPLREMVGYLKHLRSLTGGRGTFVMSVEGFERMSAQRQKAVLKELGGGEGW